MAATEDRARTGATLGAEEDAASRAFAHEPGEGEALWWIGMLAAIKATAEQTGGRYTLVEILAPDGFASPLHVHHGEDEAFWILEGDDLLRRRSDHKGAPRLVPLRSQG